MLLNDDLSNAIRDLVFQPMHFGLSLHFIHTDITAVQSWLQQIRCEFNLDSLPQNLYGVSGTAGSVWVNDFSNCIAEMAQLIFRQVNCPIFACPRVIALKPSAWDKSAFEVTFSFQNIGSVNRTTVEDVLLSAVDMCNWLGMQTPANSSLLKAGKEHLKNEVLNKFQDVNSIHFTNMKLLEIAYRMGIHYCRIGDGIYRLGFGKNAYLVCGSIAQEDSGIGLTLASDKFYTAHILRMAAIPAVAHKEVTDVANAIQAAGFIGYPVVVKPVDNERGEGVTVDVFRDDAISEAYEKALSQSRSGRVLVEKQVSGVCHRLFMVHGELLYAVKRWPPSVFGNGMFTIKQLVETAYQAELIKLPSEQKPLLPWDDETESFVHSCGFTVDYVPVLGERIALRRIESTKWGGFDEEVTDRVHPDTLRQVSIACRLLHLSVCGVDVITEDISRPLSQTGGVINELNGGPLLGGGEISRCYIPEYLQRLVPHNGKIPIKIFRLAESEQAMTHFRAQVKSGQQCYFTSDALTLDFLGNEMLEQKLTLTERLRILIFHPDVEALCIVSDMLFEASVTKQQTELV